ncbi:MAG: ADP-ribosylglycohydrolase family protein [Muribaculaceae bacterium]|nr:ADP-ribosylglycohydrolase family protein [Muribaculaceae bacterium]
MQRLGRKYPDVGYGPDFKDWLSKDNPLPYYSYGNGSAMRVSPVGMYAQTLNEALELGYITASLSHNHPEGIKGAQATATSIYMARHKYSKQHIREVVSVIYDYNLWQTIEEIRSGYIWNDYCQRSVPEAIMAFLDGRDFEDVVRLAVSLGGDADTQAAIAGGIAACVYPIPEHIAVECERRLPAELLEIMRNFEAFIKERRNSKIYGSEI